MPERLQTLLVIGAAIAGLGLALRVDQTRPTHQVITMYGLGIVGAALLASLAAAICEL